MNHWAFAAVIVSLSALEAGGQTLFVEDWDDGAGGSRWTAPIVALERPTFGFDGSVDYAFDYSVLGAPSAPGSVGGTTTGVFMETNTTDNGPGDEGESVGILPLNFMLPDSGYRLTADVYLFWNGDSSGSTEYATLGVHHQGSDNVPLRFGLNNGDGVAWQVDTDGDSGSDLLRFDEEVGDFGLGGYEDIPNGSIPGVPTGDADPIGPFNQWVELSITSGAGVIEFAMNGFVIDSVVTSPGDFSGGTLLIGQSDPFNSVSPDDAFGNSNGVVFDNIRVEAIAAGIPGDANGDGSVDLLDLDILGQNFGRAGDATPGEGDFNGDGGVDLLDLDILGANFGATAGAAVPEPVAWWLPGAAVGLMPRRRYKPLAARA